MKILSRFCFCLFLFACTLSVQAQLTVDAGSYQKICPGLSVGLGGNPTASGGVGTYTYTWAPTINLSSSSAKNPTAYPNVTTTYTVSVVDAAGEVRKDTVTIFVYGSDFNAGNDTTIQQGQTITLHAHGPTVISVYWNTSTTGIPTNIYHENTLMPDVFPSITTTYTIVATFPNNCTVYDFLTVTVIPNDNLIFYNTFSPNGDGSNDIFYIGNIGKYPDNVLEIYNRYGQKIYTKNGYQNDWDGKYMNEEVPAGTYYYMLDAKNNAAGVSGGKHKGSVTIVR